MSHTLGERMAIFAIGAYYETDVSQEFIARSLVGVGWSSAEAPELHEYVKSLKVGDIIYIKSAPPSSPDIHVKGIGIVRDNEILDAISTANLVSAGRNVLWLHTWLFSITKPTERNNVRLNTIYEELHPDVQQEILRRLAGRQGAPE